MTENKGIGRSHSKKHYHEQSMDDFMKNIRKFNLRSQRYLANKPFNMYLRQNTTKTMEKSRSRTLSNRKSLSKSKKMKKKIESILCEKHKLKNHKHKDIKIEESCEKNLTEIIEDFSERVGKVQKYLQNKNQVALVLCNKFREVLNQIIQTSMDELNSSLREMEKKTVEKIQKQYQVKLNKMTNYTKKLEFKAKELVSKLQSNSKLLYQLRMNSDLDIDYIFGVSVLNTTKCGGIGYSIKKNSESDQFFKEEEEQQRREESGRIRPAFGWEKQQYERYQYEIENREFQRKSL